MNQTPSSSASSVSTKKPVQRKASSPTTSKTVVSKGKALKNTDPQLLNEQIALRAYFIGERRRKLGIPGDETSDWVEAERELSAESKAG